MTDGGGGDGRDVDPDTGVDKATASPSDNDRRPAEGVRDVADAGDRAPESRDSTGRAPTSRYERSRDEPDRPPVRGDGAAEDDDVAEWVLLVRDVATSVGAVVLVGAYLFAISGVWPPMVAIESGSMQPNMNVNDLVFVMETDRFQPGAAHGDTGVVTAQDGREVGHQTFGAPGDVIVFAPNGDTRQTPIIHRAMFWVEEGENWVEKANGSYLGAATSCSDLRHVCPAPNDGFITKGDNNGVYDQVQRNDPVKPEWIVGTAEIRVPGLGWLRLRFQ